MTNLNVSNIDIFIIHPFICPNKSEIIKQIIEIEYITQINFNTSISNLSLIIKKIQKPHTIMLIIPKKTI